MITSKTRSQLPALVSKSADSGVVKTTPRAPSLPCVRSEDFIGKDREFMIEHAGVFYRLRITRANKLILTKWYGDALACGYCCVDLN